MKKEYDEKSGTIDEQELFDNLKAKYLDAAGGNTSVVWRWTELEAATSSPKHPGTRSSHGVSVVGSQIFVWGGEVVPRTPIDATLHVLELESSAGSASDWLTLDASGTALPSPRVAHAQAVVGQSIYFFGGRQGIAMEEAPLNDLWRFDLSTRVWEGPIAAKGGSAPSPRSFHKMVAVGSRLFVFGGCSTTGRLADLHRFDTTTREWEVLPSAADSLGLPGRGGAGFCASIDSKCLFVVGGFIGQESNVICRYDIPSATWQEVLPEGNDLVRPFSVSCCSPFINPPTANAADDDSGVCASGVIVFFGGEVDASAKGHEGAGSFSNTLLVLDGNTGMPDKTSTSAAAEAQSTSGSLPSCRGWAAADSWGLNKMVLYGGLAGDDASPVRLADTWVLSREVVPAENSKL